MKKYIVAPSLLSANFLNLEKELQILKDNKIEWIHYDVMDYHFVPNLTFGPKILFDINSKFSFKIDAHLMVKIENMNVEKYLEPFINARVHQITLHIESLSSEQIDEFIEICKKNKILFSIAINPNTSLETINNYLNKLDNILIMSVNPGFGGQGFIESTLKKVTKLKSLKEEFNYKYRIQIDGGINAETHSIAKQAGVEMLVAGSYLFGQSDIKNRIEILEND